MTTFFHITSPERWAEAAATGSYVDPSLDAEGFIHGSYLHQVLRSANKHFAGQGDRLLIEVDPASLTSRLVIEDSYGSGQSFPHVYGPINPDSVIATRPLVASADGFVLADDLVARLATMPTNADLPTHRWRGDDLATRVGEWSRSLTDVEVAAVLELAQPGSAQSDGNRELVANLGTEIREQLLNGLGFRLIQGFPIDQLDQAGRETMLLALGEAIGAPRSQNAAGHLVGHVTDVGADLGNTETRIYQTNQRQTFHTDSTDAVGLLCLRTAAEGGRSMLVSAAEVYLAVQQRRPDLAPLLFEPLATDRRGEIPPGMLPWFEIPVLSWHEGRMTVLYQRQYIESARRFDDAPHPDAAHTEALDLFDEVANEPGMALEMNLAPGDLQFVYNHGLLHDRTGFIDHPEPDARRYLLRLWLSLPGDRELPTLFAQRYGSLAVGDRGGIVTA